MRGLKVETNENPPLLLIEGQCAFCSITYHVLTRNPHTIALALLAGRASMKKGMVKQDLGQDIEDNGRIKGWKHLEVLAASFRFRTVHAVLDWR
ncbi:unnamed protein product [Lathyrus oleraceus]